MLSKKVHALRDRTCVPCNLKSQKTQRQVSLVENGPFGQDPLVPAVIWAGTKGPATSPQNRPTARQLLVPARYNPLVLVWDTNRD
jgi:hypothetical protein